MSLVFQTETVPNTKVYERVTVDDSPVSLAVMKSYLKITTTSDDALIQSMIDASTEQGEKYTGRDFRPITWDLLLDEFTNRIALMRDPVATITTVERLVSDVFVAVASTVFYLKKLVQSSEILLNEDQEWPDDADNREQVVKIRFVTEGYRCQESIIEAIQIMVAFWYRNRGDCSSCKEAATRTGATVIFDQFRISRV